MRSRLIKTIQGGLSPWGIKEDSDHESDMNEFCRDRLPTIPTHKHKPLSDRISEKFREKCVLTPDKVTPVKIKRPHSNVNNLHNTEDHRKALQKLSTNKENKEISKTAHKPFRSELKLLDLQQVSIKNFIMEGSRGHCPKESMGKKKQSTFVMKQKFAQIRRSMNLAAVTSMNRALKYSTKQDKENTLFRLTKFQPN